uniref:Uncharacterized protein n=1 Tax=Nelumbo nucifera TaxID=4432 RepID=A0A822Z7S3_NELNU|nr:TPA_asm: hypothetical protein HUJ06_015445 [Nelumbo nucifera]
MGNNLTNDFEPSYEADYMGIGPRPYHQSDIPDMYRADIFCD